MYMHFLISIYTYVHGRRTLLLNTWLQREARAVRMQAKFQAKRAPEVAHQVLRGLQQADGDSLRRFCGRGRGALRKREVHGGVRLQQREAVDLVLAAVLASAARGVSLGPAGRLFGRHALACGARF